MKRKSRKTRQRDTLPAVVGVAWYRPDQWDFLRSVSVDRASLHDTYTEWLHNAQEKRREMAERGIQTQPIEIDVNDLIAWCKANDRFVDGAARSQYTAEKVQQLSKKKPSN